MGVATASWSVYVLRQCWVGVAGGEGGRGRGEGSGGKQGGKRYPRSPSRPLAALGGARLACPL